MTYTAPLATAESYHAQMVAFGLIAQIRHNADGTYSVWAANPKRGRWEPMALPSK